MKIMRLSLSIIAGILVAGNAFAAITYSPMEVQFQVNPGQNELRAQNVNQGCTRGKGLRKGCMKFDKDQLGQITFSLLGNPATNKCIDPGTNYVITQIELSHEGYLVPDTAGPKLADKGIFTQTVPQWLKDAFPGTNNDGIVYTATKDEATNKATIINLNNQPNSAGGNEKNIWYKVSVTRCSDDFVLHSDPRFENEGTN